MTIDSCGNQRYNIVQEADGNQYLEMKGATTWFMNKQPIPATTPLSLISCSPVLAVL